jgi:hypothetical protein
VGRLTATETRRLFVWPAVVGGVITVLVSYPLEMCFLSAVLIATNGAQWADNLIVVLAQFLAGLLGGAAAAFMSETRDARIGAVAGAAIAIPVAVAQSAVVVVEFAIGSQSQGSLPQTLWDAVALMAYRAGAVIVPVAVGGAAAGVAICALRRRTDRRSDTVAQRVEQRDRADGSQPGAGSEE